MFAPRGHSYCRETGSVSPRAWVSTPKSPSSVQAGTQGEGGEKQPGLEGDTIAPLSLSRSSLNQGVTQSPGGRVCLYQGPPVGPTGVNIRAPVQLPAPVATRGLSSRTGHGSLAL